MLKWSPCRGSVNISKYMAWHGIYSKQEGTEIPRKWVWKNGPSLTCLAFLCPSDNVTKSRMYLPLTESSKTGASCFLGNIQKLESSIFFCLKNFFLKGCYYIPYDGGRRATSSPWCIRTGVAGFPPWDYYQQINPLVKSRFHSALHSSSKPHIKCEQFSLVPWDFVSESCYVI